MAHARRCLVLFLLLAAFSVTISLGQNAVEVRLNMPSRMVNDKTLTLKAELLDASGNVDWRTWSAFGTVSARRVSDGTEVPTSITFFDDHAGIPAPDSIRFYNGKGSVSITLDNGVCEPAGAIEITVSVGGLTASRIVTVLDDPPRLTLSGTISGNNLNWGPDDGVIHLTGNISWGSGNLTIEPGTLIMINPDVDINVASGDHIVAVGTEEEPIYFFPAMGQEAMLLPNICTYCDGGTRSNELAWGQIRHSGTATSTFEFVFFTGGGNGSSEGHTRPPMLRFVNSSSFDLRDSVLADIPGKAIYCSGNGTYNIVRSLITRCGHGSEFTGVSGYTLNILDTWYTGVGRGPGRVSCEGTSYDCGFDGDLINPRSPGNILIKGCVLTDGGDEAIDGSTAQITVEDTIMYNVRDRAYTDDGGGAHATFRNCLIFGNGGAFGGGGGKTLLNTTVYGGGGVGGSGNLVEKSILWPQTLNGCPGTFNYNLVGPGTTVNCNEGNFNANPEFVKTSGPNYDFDLQPTSPAVNAGPSGERVGWLGFPEGVSCAVDADCNDSNACTDDTCSSGACHNHSISGCVPCDIDEDCERDPQCGGACTVGICSYGGACDDGLSCTTADDCVGGFCVGTDSCPEGMECSHAVDACILVPTTLIFQQDVEGYSGTQDTYIFQQFADESYGDSDLVEWDGQESTAPPGEGTIIGLIRFEDIFGTGPGQIPVVGEEINSATFQYTTEDVGDDGEVREALVDWTELATWNGFGPDPGPQEEDYGPLQALAPGSPPGGGLTSSSVDVTASIRKWSENPSENKGWVLLPTGDNGSEFWSSEYSSDITTRPKLVVVYGGSTPLPNVLRQPYLQKATPTSMTIVWKTDFPSDSRVSFGTTPDVFDLMVLDPTTATNHIVTLSGLTPETTYYYEVGSSTETHAGGCSDHHFTTPAWIGTPAPFNAWIFSDSGRHSAMQFMVRNAMTNATSSDPPDLVLHAGDVDQGTPTAADYTLHHFEVYEEILSHTAFYSTIGNHDGYTSNSSSQSGPYFDAFDYPSQGENGGLASGTEAYYSFDYANAHFICLDSEEGSLEPDSTMLTWLEADLAATDQSWLIAYWHHPPYSKGSHDSDNAGDSGARLTKVRENVLPLLEAGGVDLVLSGHDHDYERSYLIDGVYGYGTSPNYATPSYSTLLANGNILDNGNGRLNSNGPYVKSPGLNPHEGTVYIVTGHGGSTLDPTVGDHPVMYFKERRFGSLFVEFEGNSLTLSNIRDDGAVSDYFTIVKPCSGDADCDDGRFCNGTATCVSGNCVPDGQPCPGQLCDEQLDTCVECLIDWDCDDELFCNGSETCQLDGFCGPGTEPCSPGTECDEDLDICLDEDCVIDEDCDDGNPCSDDFCTGGMCEYFDNTVACNDGDACTIGDACIAGACEGGPGLTCDDGNLCTDDSCDPGSGCVFANNTATCDDSNACTTGDACSAGSCEGGPGLTCDDGNPCTDDSCDPASGCEFVNNAAPCDDGDACTTGDTCSAGACESGPGLTCDDGNLCTNDSCDPASGCVFVNNSASCDDGNACTTDDTCSAGACESGPGLTCDDGNPCTDDSCDPASGCLFTDNTAPCDDGNACTTSDACNAGSCEGGAPLTCNDGNLCTDDSCDPASGCVFVNNATSCSDGEACTENDVCALGICTGSLIDCSSLDDICNAGVCNPGTGQCEPQPLTNGTACDDEQNCTGNDACTDGVCAGTEECPSEQFCDPEGQCAYSVELVFSDDGVHTGTRDTFIQQSAPDTTHGSQDYWEWDTANGAPSGPNYGLIRFDEIIGGEPDRIPPGARILGAQLRLVVWDSSTLPAGEVHETPVDWDETTVKWSTFGGEPGVQPDEVGAYVADAPIDMGTFDIDVTGSLQAWANDPNANHGWIVVPKSTNGVHVRSAEYAVAAERPKLTVQIVAAACDIDMECDDGVFCNGSEICDSGVCRFSAPVDCDDGNLCTDDSCDPASGCVFTDNTAPCDDGSACTTDDTCSAGACEGGPDLTCNDGNSCTDDSCDPASGCVFTDNTAPCDDGSACTTDDTCSAGTCGGGPDLTCDDGNLCTDDSCDPASGCEFTDNTAPCDDGNACTTDDACSAGACQGGPGLTCDDGNLCTDDSCDPASGCVFVNNTAPCDDGDACTTDDTCNAGACEGGPDLICEDSNLCTDDSCDSASGCVFVNNTVPCNDGNACTTDDACSTGSCEGGPGLPCDDGNLCTDDSCDPASGCVFTDNTAPCDDGNACTTNDTCSAGACEGGPALVCSDSNLCTDDSCDPASGCVFTDNTAPCDDDNPCTTDDTCSAGACEGGPDLTCNDGNSCTDDSCDPASGCVFIDNTAPCDDGNACTTDDTCSAGTCEGGPDLTCNDGNSCTDDNCDPASGCVFIDNTAPCDDGNACTTDDTCSAGACQGGPDVTCNDGNLCTDDSCDPASGCVFVNNTAPCDDGDACTTDDTCNAGSCESGPALVCNDSNLCTDDSCDPATGCVFTDNLAPCNDGNACTTDDTCSAGACEGGPDLICEDSNLCTDDGCDPASGCVFVDNVAPCDDGNSCTTDDTCNTGSCEGGSALICDDINPCTDDSCDPASGCVFVNNIAPCDDGDACTEDDLCSDGICVGTLVVLAEVEHVLCEPGAVMTWDDQGTGIEYDVASGLLADLHVDGGVLAAECLQDGVGEATFTDPRPDPAPATGYYYLIRSQSACGDGSYGDTSEGIERLLPNGCP